MDTQTHLQKQLSARADLQREEDDGETDHRGDAHSHDDAVCVIEASDHTHHVGETQRQDGLYERKQTNYL